MLIRRIINEIQNFYKTSKGALLLTGARQIGKTHVIRRFGNENFKHFVEINFVDKPEAIEVFSKPQSATDILLKLSAYTKTPFAKGKTLIFFDEVQKCPEIVTAIKFLVDQGDYRYIMSGSLLGVELGNLRSVPVGYMAIKDMYPLDFEEFLWAIGIGHNIIESLKNSWNTNTPVDSFIHKKIMEAFRLYLIIGGMPAVVMAYIRSNNLQDVTEAQKQIIRLYKKDISQYNEKHQLKIKGIFDLIPTELNAKNKRFFIKSLSAKARAEMYSDDFLWLKDAGVAIPTYNAEEPKPPLLLASSRNLFKLFSNDIGLLACQYSGGIQLRMLTGDDNINFGAIYENAVAQELLAHGFQNLYYYNSKKMGEVDFIIEHEGHALPIEVKSGKDYSRHRALNNILDCTEYDIPQAIVLCNDNIEVRGKVKYAPIYMTMFIHREPNLDIQYKIDLSGLR